MRVQCVPFLTIPRAVVMPRAGKPTFLARSKLAYSQFRQKFTIHFRPVQLTVTINAFVREESGKGATEQAVEVGRDLNVAEA